MRVKMFRTRRWKLIHYEGESGGELYDLASDPWELRNLYSNEKHKIIREELKQRLSAHQAKCCRGARGA
ncbi:MAG: sulfatase/phosphatase domain-containing protein [Planctomycetota bacterium]